MAAVVGRALKQHYSVSVSKSKSKLEFESSNQFLNSAQGLFASGTSLTSFADQVKKEMDEMQRIARFAKISLGCCTRQAYCSLNAAKRRQAGRT